MAGVKKKFAVGSLWFFLGQGVSNIASFIIFAILARLLGPVDFGIVAFASVFIELSRSVALAGLPTALIKDKVWDEDAASTAFWGNIGFSIVLALAVGGGLGYALTGTYGENLDVILAALSVSLVIDAMRATHEAKLQRDFQFKNLAKRTALATTGAGIIGVLLAFAGFGVWALVINRIANSVIQTIIIWQATPWRPRWTFHRDKFVAMFKFGIHLGASAVFGQINRRVPELLAGLIISPVAVGFYKVGGRMVNILFDLTITPMQRTAIAGFSRLEGEEALVRGYRGVTRAVSLVAFPAFYGMAALGRDLVILLFGERWAESGVIMSALALFGGAAAVSYFVQPLLAAAGKTHLASMRSLLTLLSNIIVCLCTAPFGTVVLAIGFAARAYVGVIPTLTLLKKAVGLPPSRVLADVFPTFFAAVIMGLTVYGLRYYVLQDHDRLLSLAMLVPLGAVIYAAVLALFFRKYMRVVWQDLEPLAGPALAKLKGRRPAA
ncbi:lipopolysaccharide biosynthesis protein [Agaricicola taiwanensis]|uniref:Lipopolysaccharide biosynthesis protein n=1 Tax=Agaricicola taiwanensis TaxID=591372 RepID=A0A8J3DW68_9RHOB|nr:lipopolysaccharide biosynthesis protein [Agaricicola taiwanensis]GGE48916.1 lipopolysaccharide biosynthesis protein [Agaricicola taiwanensis]